MSKNWLRVAHRGAPLKATENTMASFREAVESGAKWIELDVLMTTDKQLVVYHDFSLHRIFKMRRKVEGMSWEEIKNINTETHSIPLLTEVLRLCYEKEIGCYIELKSKRKEISEEVIKVLENFKDKEKFVVSSFQHSHLKRIKENHPELRTMALAKYTWSVSRSLFAKNQADQLGISLKGSGCPSLNWFIENEIPVFVYTVNCPLQEKMLQEKKVSGIFTDTF